VRRLSDREKSWLAVFLIVAVLAAGVQFAYFPLLDKSRGLKEEKARYASQWEQIERNLSRQSGIREELDRLRAEIEAWNQVMVPGDATYLYWERIAELAGQAGVNASLMQEGEEGTRPGTRTAHQRVSGPAEAVLAFLDGLERLEHPLAVTGGDIQVRENEAEVSLAFLISAM